MKKSNGCNQDYSRVNKKKMPPGTVEVRFFHNHENDWKKSRKDQAPINKRFTRFKYFSKKKDE